jgi:hypothetical protein
MCLQYSFVYDLGHRVYRGPEILAGLLNWLPPHSSTASECVPFPGSMCGEGGHTLACGKRVGGANSDEGTDTMVLMYTNSSLLLDLGEG